MNFSVIASFTVALETVELFEGSLAKLAAKTQQEPGCIEYEVHKNSEIDGAYFIIEKYLTYEDYVAHRESAHILEFKAAVGNSFIQPPIVLRGSKAW